MSDDLIQLMADAWRRIEPTLARDPDELRRRLARRRMGMMRRAVRAWCLAVRASDTRINPATARMVPEAAAYPKSHLVGVEPRYARHQVTLDARLLRRICRPVFIPAPGVTLKELAKMLGCSPENLLWASTHGAFSVHKVRGLGGVPRDVPVYYTNRPLDPAGGKMWEYPDILWGTQWKYLGDRVPEDLEQTLVRVPLWMAYPDSPKRGDGGMRFRGWRWICPSCGRKVRTVFYPLAPVYGVKLLKREMAADDPDALPEPLRGFACTKCHDVLYFSRVDSQKWNHLISHLSGGLLYGNEVPRPKWYVQTRKRAFHPMLMREPSKRRQEVREGLLKGLSYTQLSLRLGVKRCTIAGHARLIYRQENVQTRAQWMLRQGGVKSRREVVARTEAEKMMIRPKAATTAAEEAPCI